MFEMQSGVTLLSVLAALVAFAVMNVHVPDAGDGGGDGGDGGDGGGTGGDGGDGADGGDAGDGRGDGDRRAAGDGQGGDGDDDLDDDEREREELLNSLTPEEQNKRIRTWNRKNARALKALRPIAEMFRGPDGRFMSPQEIQRIRSLASDMEEFEPLLQSDPDLVKTILEKKNGRGRTAVAEEQFVDPYADETKFPFDTSTDAGRWMLENARRDARDKWELKQQLKGLQQALGDVNTRDTTRTIQQHEQSWKSAVRTAAAELPDYMRQPFADAVRGIFEVAKREGRLERLNVKQIVDRYLEPYKRSTKGQARRDAGTRQAGAERNRNLPPPHNRGRAATAQETNRKDVGTIRDGRKSFFARIGQSSPPSSR